MNKQELWVFRTPDLVYEVEAERARRGISMLPRKKLHRLRKEARRRPGLPKHRGGKR